MTRGFLSEREVQRAHLRARAILPNQGLHPLGDAIARAHPRAIQYLEAAPVLALAVPNASTARIKAVHEWLRFKMGPMCEAGLPLKDVLRAFELSPPLRKLSGYGLAPGYSHLVLRLSREVPPAVLGRIIPEKKGAQKRWLAACAEWLDRLARRPHREVTYFAWAAEAMALAGVAKRDVGHVADFAMWPDSGFSPAWGWPRATAEAHRWHARLTLERTLRDTPFAPDTQVDFGRHPDVEKVEGFAFLALRTPLALFEEGAAMRHCVATYLKNVVDRRCHIVAVRQGDKHVATLELDPKTWVSRQLKGPCNGPVSEAVRHAVIDYVMARRAEARLT